MMIVLALVISSASQATVAEPTSPSTMVRTLAGTGALGVADGEHGSFMAPYGVAYGPDGTLYVSDAIGQRVRMVSPTGRVTTLAGGGPIVDKGLWVRGGYRDGKGSQARFDHPAGLAWSRGRLYVADTNNHCIRVITPDGTVSTFAGSPGTSGVSDGPVTTAAFKLPAGLAAAADGTLYVADYFGIRSIHDGIVKTIPAFGAGGPWSVAVSDTAQGTVVYAAGVEGIDRMGADGKIDRFLIDDQSPTPHRNMEGIEPLGFPSGIAAIGEYFVIYTDVRENTVRLLDWYAGAPQIIGGIDVYDGISSAAGWADGRGDASRFDAPMGVAVGRNRQIAVADMANRRVRIISGLDLDHESLPAESEAGIPRKASEYRIAFVGNSAVTSYLRWDDGIPGIVERKVRADPRAAMTKRSFVVIPFVFAGSPIQAQASYIESLLAEMHAADLIIFNLNTVSLYDIGGLSDRPTDREMIEKGPQWTAVVTESLRTMDGACKRNGVKFIVYTTPVGDNVSSTEGSWGHLESEPTFLEPSTEVGDLMNAAVQASGVTYFDGWSVLENEIRSPQHIALFGTQDPHFSPHGRAVIGNALADFLVRTKPWGP
jgi:DNA-binding beta-propeller fold protein YncE